MADASVGKLDIGRVVSGTFKVVGDNPAAFAILILVVAVLPSLLMGAVQLTASGGPESFVLSPLYWLMLPVIVAATLVGSAALLWLTGETLAGARPGAVAALRAGLPRAWPLLLLMIVQGAGVMLGFILLVVPGLMLLVAWAVSAPALVSERSKVFDSLKLSQQLTKGNRWRIFGLLLLLMVAFLLIFAGIGAVGGWTMLVGQDAAGLLLIQPLSNAVTYLISYVGAGVLYAELKGLRHGVGAESLAKVFD